MLMKTLGLSSNLRQRITGQGSSAVSAWACLCESVVPCYRNRGAESKCCHCLYPWVNPYLFLSKLLEMSNLWNYHPVFYCRTALGSEVLLQFNSWHAVENFRSLMSVLSGLSKNDQKILRPPAPPFPFPSLLPLPLHPPPPPHLSCPVTAFFFPSQISIVSVLWTEHEKNMLSLPEQHVKPWHFKCCTSHTPGQCGLCGTMQHTTLRDEEV